MIQKTGLLLLFTLFLNPLFLKGNNILLPLPLDSFQEEISTLPLTPGNLLPLEKFSKSKLLKILQNTTQENKKIIAATLTITLGMLGVHRIYLGTAPYIPAVYLFTFGVAFLYCPLLT